MFRRRTPHKSPHQVEGEMQREKRERRRTETERGAQREWAQERRGGCKLRVSAALCDLNLTGGLETAPVPSDSPFPLVTPFHSSHSPPQLLWLYTGYNLPLPPLKIHLSKACGGTAWWRCFGNSQSVSLFGSRSLCFGRGRRRNSR